MRIDRELIARVARLAALEPSPDEADALAAQLTRIVEHFETLRSVPEDLLAASPAAPPGADREDVPRERGAPGFAMENAPESAHGHFVVPRVVFRG